MYNAYMKKFHITSYMLILLCIIKKGYLFHKLLTIKCIYDNISFKLCMTIIDEFSQKALVKLCIYAERLKEFSLMTIFTYTLVKITDKFH